MPLRHGDNSELQIAKSEALSTNINSTSASSHLGDDGHEATDRRQTPPRSPRR
jgi:hypothetical protein